MRCSQLLAAHERRRAASIPLSTSYWFVENGIVVWHGDPKRVAAWVSIQDLFPRRPTSSYTRDQGADPRVDAAAREQCGKCPNENNVLLGPEHPVPRP